MLIKFNQKHKSIEQFEDTQLPNFSILVGKNGAGKTHFLKAIEDGSVSLDSIAKEEIRYFNFQDFQIKTQAKASNQDIDSQKMQAWSLLRPIQKSIEPYDEALKKIAGNLKFPYQCEIPEKEKAQYSLQIDAIKNAVNAAFNNHPALKNNGKIKKLLFNGIFDSGKYASEISEIEFLNTTNYNPGDYELLESLSEIFIDYRKNMLIAAEPKSKGGGGLKKNAINEMNTSSPWSFLNNMFQEFQLPHLVTFPNFSTSDVLKTKAISFQAKLRIENEHFDFSDLSSGEKILFALAVTIYQNKKSKFPKAILLDEVDTSLHPSMIKNLLSVINNVFIQNGCKIILATHSPTTVALAEEKCLYEVQKGRPLKKIKKISKADAINILSEGLVAGTTEGETQILSYRLSHTTKPAIFTEGTTDKIILLNAWKKLYQNETIPFDIIDSRGGAQFLRNYIAIDFLQQSGDRKGLALFDFDTKGYSQWKGINENFSQKDLLKQSSNNKAFAMPLLPPEHLKHYVYDPHDSSILKAEDLKLEIEHLFIKSDGTDTFMKLCPNAKVIRTILDIGTKVSVQKYQEITEDFIVSDFENFKPLFEKIKLILL